MKISFSSGLLLFCLISICSIEIKAYGNPDQSISGNWKYYSSEDAISESEYFQILRSQDKWKKFDFEERIRVKDDLEISHRKYSIKKDSYEVFGLEINLHIENGLVKSVQFIPEINFQRSRINIDSNEALILARETDPLKYNKALLIYSGLSWVANEKKATDFHLAHKIEIKCENQLNNRLVFIDSENGLSINEFELSASCNSKTSTTLLPLNNGLQIFNVQDEDNTYRLIDECRTNPSESIITMTGYGANPIDLINDPLNKWDTGILPFAAQCHWASSQFYDLLLYEFGRLSYDGQGSKMISSLDSSQTDGAGLIYSSLHTIHGKESNAQDRYWVSLDIVGHEWTHAIIFLESILLWNYEGRAIAEGICDIFGTLNEFRAEQKFDSLKSGDWLIAEDQNTGPIRDLSNPLSLGYSDTYKSPVYNSATNKYERSSPFSFWYYLLSEGGHGINNHDSSIYNYDVNGIGMEKSNQILYRSMLYYLQPQSNYLDTRYATQQSAIDLFGECSNEFKSVIEAWNAVGVYTDSLYCQSIQEMQDISLRKYQVYPIPAKNELFINDYNESIFYTISGLNGNVILSDKLSGNSNKIDVSELDEGLYILIIQSQSGTSHHKFIRE